MRRARSVPLARKGPKASVESLLTRLELVIFQGSNVNAISQKAHYILPSAAFAEKGGTFTNEAGRVQRIHPALKPIGKSKEDWRILVGLAEKMGLRYETQEAEKTFQSLARSISAFKGLSCEKIGSGGAMLTEVVK